MTLTSNYSLSPPPTYAPDIEYVWPSICAPAWPLSCLFPLQPTSIWPLPFVHGLRPRLLPIRPGPLSLLNSTYIPAFLCSLTYAHDFYVVSYLSPWPLSDLVPASLTFISLLPTPLTFAWSFTCARDLYSVSYLCPGPLSCLLPCPWPLPGLLPTSLTSIRSPNYAPDLYLVSYVPDLYWYPSNPLTSSGHLPIPPDLYLVFYLRPRPLSGLLPTPLTSDWPPTYVPDLY